ncbi:uncharacterized protein LOC143187589, partial [Calliopsis andreniformis]|uniref:uncharacterized protein LOC143187589 n=1 Tax=Calliopsis andreniformis TaxID=337506 RepID=UPI003FCD3689
IHSSLNNRANHFILINSSCFLRICSTMRSNIILRSNSNYKLIICPTLYWSRFSRMNLRRIFN